MLNKDVDFNMRTLMLYINTEDRACRGEVPSLYSCSPAAYPKTGDLILLNSYNNNNLIAIAKL